MGRLSFLILGLVVGLVAGGCATQAAFTYHFYGLDAVSYDGTLQGPTAAQDLSLKECAPDPVDPAHPEAAKPGKCIVMKSADFYKMKGDYLMTQQDLISCQKGCSK